MNLSFKNHIIQSKFNFIKINEFRRLKWLVELIAANSNFELAGRISFSLAKLNHDKYRVKYIRWWNKWKWEKKNERK
jgi:hypothetical protein